MFVYPVKNLAKAKALYRRLIGVPYLDEVYYVGFDIDGQDVRLDPHGHSKGLPGPVGYWQVDDIHASLRELLDAGATSLHEVNEAGDGKLTALVQDADGNIIGLVQST